MGSNLSLGDIHLAPFVARLYLLEEHRGFTLHKDDIELQSAFHSHSCYLDNPFD